MPALCARLLVVTLSVAACSDDDATQPSSTSAAATDGSYAVLAADAWALQEAVDPPADAPIASIEQPLLEWYAEYVQSSASASAMVRLSGHHATFDATRTTLEGLGFALDDVSLAGRRWFRPGGPASPTIIVLANGGTTLMALSYEPNLDQLTTIVDEIEAVDQTTWVAAGGVIQ